MTLTTTLTIAPTPKAKRDLHPRGQLRYHQTAANRASKKADWLRELADRFESSDPEDRYGPADYPQTNRAEAAALDAKCLAHLRACVILNDEHALGFPVTQSMLRTLGMESGPKAEDIDKALAQLKAEMEQPAFAQALTDEMDS